MTRASTEDATVIGRATVEDLPVLLALYRQMNASDPELTAEQARQVFAAIEAQPGLSLFVARIDNRAIATATLVVVPNLTRGARPYALVENVVTDEAFRNRGHARAVIAHAIQTAWEAGCYKVMLLTGRTDPAIHRFYEGCGFRQDKTGFQIRRP